MVPALPSSSESSMSKMAAVRWNGCITPPRDTGRALRTAARPRRARRERAAALQLGREAGNASRFLADELAGEDQVAHQLAFVGVLEPGLGRELARLAEVVEQASGGDQVAIELRVVIADPPAELHHRER